VLDLIFSAEVAEARVKRKPIVALESTIVAHGLPWPDNFAIARELEAAVRSGGAVPATIAVVDGRVRIGLDMESLEKLARDGKSYAKAGAADLAVYLARGKSAATTVSATSVLAERAGIRVFATGGIGGVHRGYTGDVSHDLIALAKTPVAVVSAGAKAILDLPRTAEMLETLGVLVIGYRTHDFPAFYTRSSGLRLDHATDDIAELAHICTEHWARDGAGILVCNPIPADAELELGDAIERALANAAAQRITGKALTPFLLAELAATTAGKSIAANRALAVDNARVAAALATACTV